MKDNKATIAKLLQQIAEEVHELYTDVRSQKIKWRYRNYYPQGCNQAREIPSPLALCFKFDDLANRLQPPTKRPWHCQLSVPKTYLFQTSCGEVGYTLLGWECLNGIKYALWAITFNQSKYLDITKNGEFVAFGSTDGRLFGSFDAGYILPATEMPTQTEAENFVAAFFSQEGVEKRRQEWQAVTNMVASFVGHIQTGEALNGVNNYTIPSDEL